MLSPLEVACRDDAREYKRLQILAAAFHVADALEARCPSPTVGLLMPTAGAFPIAALGAWIAGKAVVPLNYLLKPAELQYVIDDSGASAVLTVQPMLDHLGSPPRCGALIRLEELAFRSVPALRWPDCPSPDDLAVLLYTSGTSGKPKGVMLSHDNVQSNLWQIASWVDFTRADTLLGVLPQFHSFGLTVLTLLPLTMGCRVVYSARFVPQRIVKLFRQHRPTVFVGVPSMYNALLQVKDATGEDFSSLRYAVSGGEPLPDAVASAFLDRFGVRINEGYGLTETSPVTNWCRPHEYRAHSVGRALAGIHERIVDLDTGLDLPAGRDGEVRIKGPNLMRGYFNLPEASAAAFDELGYLRTGDIGRLDGDGHLFITGRLKEMLIVAGENVFPREIEEVLNRHPAIQDSGVVGRPDPMRGEEPVAFVQLKENASLEPDDAIRFCRQHLAAYKAPVEVRVLPELPRGPTGKVVRRELKALLSTPGTTP